MVQSVPLVLGALTELMVVPTPTTQVLSDKEALDLLVSVSMVGEN